MFQRPTKCPGSLWYRSSSYVPLDCTYWNFIAGMAFVCLIVCMMHTEIVGLHLMEATCEKVHPFAVTSSALPVLDVLHLGKTDGTWILATSWSRFILDPQVSSFPKVRGCVCPASELGNGQGQLWLGVTFFTYIWTSLNLNILNR